MTEKATEQPDDNDDEDWMKYANAGFGETCLLYTSDAADE